MTSAARIDAAENCALEALLELRFKASADRLKLVRGSVRAAARMSGFGDQVAQNVVLAVDEACQNIIVHGYRGRDDGEIVLTLFRRADGLLVRLRDSAPPIDPAQVKPRALSDVRPGQLGSYFMQEIMDRVEFRPASGGGNVLEMIKLRDPPT